MRSSLFNAWELLPSRQGVDTIPEGQLGHFQGDDIYLPLQYAHIPPGSKQLLRAVSEHNKAIESYGQIRYVVNEEKR